MGNRLIFRRTTAIRKNCRACRVTLTVTVITRNEARVIARCLESVAWADHIVVLDSASTDGTPDIARKLQAQVTTSLDWPGFGPQKNRALEMATGDWGLSLDADEWVTPELRKDIETAMREPGNHAAFRLPRLSSYCGRFMRHSGWWPDYVTRLFRRGAARFSPDLVHERLIVDGTTGTLQASLMHEAIVDLDDALHKMNAYSSCRRDDAIRARQSRLAHQRCPAWRMDIRAHVRAAARISRRTRGFYARRLERRRRVLPLSEARLAG